MAKVIQVGCKLPHGLTIAHPLNPDQKVTLNGINRATIIGATHGTTEVDDELFKLWADQNEDFPALKNGAIFVAKSAADLVAVGKEREKVKTGFEPKAPKSGGVKPADEKEGK